MFGRAWSRVSDTVLWLVRMSVVSQEPTLASIPESPTLNDMEFRSMWVVRVIFFTHRVFCLASIHCASRFFSEDPFVIVSSTQTNFSCLQPTSLITATSVRLFNQCIWIFLLEALKSFGKFAWVVSFRAWMTLLSNSFIRTIIRIVNGTSVFFAGLLKVYSSVRSAGCNQCDVNMSSPFLFYSSPDLLYIIWIMPIMYNSRRYSTLTRNAKSSTLTRESKKFHSLRRDGKIMPQYMM